jgi:hypothetical protein
MASCGLFSKGHMSIIYKQDNTKRKICLEITQRNHDHMMHQWHVF